MDALYGITEMENITPFVVGSEHNLTKSSLHFTQQSESVQSPHVDPTRKLFMNSSCKKNKMPNIDKNWITKITTSPILDVKTLRNSKNRKSYFTKSSINSPITLMNVDLKIITKIFTRRPKPILSKILHEDQYAQPGKQISELNCLMRDILEEMENSDHDSFFPI